MRVHLVFTVTDLDTGEVKTITEGNALLSADNLLYKEDETGFHNIVSFKDECMILERKADVSSKTILDPSKRGKCVVSSPYGDMFMETETIFIRQDEDRWEAEYRILSDQGRLSHQKLVWRLSQLDY